jgi:hypothetical protein
LVVLLVAAAATALAFALVPRQTGSELTAVVTVDGKTAAMLPLYPPDAGEESAFYTINDIPYLLVLEYKSGAIRVSDAECPGKDCARTGWISNVGEQIICLPNHLVITLTGKSPASFDAVTG